MRVNQRRSDVEIIAEILRISENSSPKTRIMYNANLSYCQLKKYLSFLTNQGYLYMTKGHDSSVEYQATEKGLHLLSIIDNLVEKLGINE